MKQLKIYVCLAFISAFAGFELYISRSATGQTGATTLSTPTGVTATDNLYNSKVGVYWDAIRGASLYRVFRSTSNDSTTAVEIGTTASNSFFDTTAVPTQTFFYWIKAENGTATSTFSVPDAGVRSAAQQQGPVPPLEPPPVPAGNQI